MGNSNSGRRSEQKARSTRDLSESDVAEIKRLTALGLGANKIAERFGIWPAVVSRVKSGTLKCSTWNVP